MKTPHFVSRLSAFCLIQNNCAPQKWQCTAESAVLKYKK